MKLIELLLPLLGVVLGAVISGAGVFWKARTERKRLIAAALAELLEVRHQLVSVDAVFGELRKRVELPSEAIPVLRGFLANFFPADPELRSRYSAAVNTLASVDPLLAYRLRSKDAAPEMLEEIRKFSAVSGMDVNQVEAYAATLHQLIGPHLDEVVIELAAAHSWRTKRRVLRMLEAGSKVPDQLIAWLDQIKPEAVST